jgi:hypothetical protein
MELLYKCKNFNHPLRRIEYSCRTLTKIFAVLEKAIKVSAEMAKLIITNACVLPNSIIQQNSNAEDSFTKESNRTTH